MGGADLGRDPRESQITFSALGQEAPLDAKRAWDPTGAKKGRLRDAVAARLPEFEVRSGGSTSVDITVKGVDKAYGMTRLSDQTAIPLSDMLFVGDRLDTDGNDYPVKALGCPAMPSPVGRTPPTTSCRWRLGSPGPVGPESWWRAEGERTRTGGPVSGDR